MAHLESWPGQLAKEAEKANDDKGKVTELIQEVQKLSPKVQTLKKMELTKYSNQVVCEIFHHLIAIGKTAKAK